jgi:CRISPR-associated protein Cmr1
MATHDDLVREERSYRFLTPVFGGGVSIDTLEPWKKHADPRTPVRVPSIRGQLRFWWRACNPRGCDNPARLLEEEAKVFGSTTAKVSGSTMKASPLSIAVVNGPEPARDVQVFKDRFVVVDDKQGRAYAAFPLRDTGKDGTRHGVLHEHPGTFTLALRYPASIAEGVEAALWAWAHFGGLGGRTRRGFGAVAEVGRNRGSLATIDDGWTRFVSGALVPWPHLPALGARRIRTKGGWKSGADAQEYLLGVLRRLRQGDIGRRREADDVPGRHPGRSYWPEPDAIRERMDARAPDHKKRVTQIDAFPRAAFGMPIIFHFKDRLDPPDTTLMPQVIDPTTGRLEVKGRLASPLILRPHRAPDGAIEAMALALAHRAADGLALVDKQKKPNEVPNRQLTKSEALNLGLGGRPSPFVTMNGAVVADPIDRFLEEIR